MCERASCQQTRQTRKRHRTPRDHLPDPPPFFTVLIAHHNCPLFQVNTVAILHADSDYGGPSHRLAVALQWVPSSPAILAVERRNTTQTKALWIQARNKRQRRDCGKNLDKAWDLGPLGFCDQWAVASSRLIMGWMISKGNEVDQEGIQEIKSVFQLTP